MGWSKDLFSGGNKKHNQNLPLKNQHSDKDEEICCHQPSSPAAASRCPVTQMSPLTFVALAMARAGAVVVVAAVVVEFALAGARAVAVVVAMALSRAVAVVRAVVVAMAVVMVWRWRGWQGHGRWQLRWQSW